MAMYRRKSKHPLEPCDPYITGDPRNRGSALEPAIPIRFAIEKANGIVGWLQCSRQRGIVYKASPNMRRYIGNRINGVFRLALKGDLTITEIRIDETPQYGKDED